MKKKLLLNSSFSTTRRLIKKKQNKYYHKPSRIKNLEIVQGGLQFKNYFKES